MKPLFFAVAFAVASAPEGTAPEGEPIAPVAVTAKRVPDLGDPFEISMRHIQERELAKRPHQRNDLKRYRALWDQMRVQNYRYTVSMVGGWGIDNGAVVVTVRNGTATSAEYSRPPLHTVRGDIFDNPTPPDVAIAPPYDSVPSLFAIVERALDNPSVLITTSYDSQYGFPTLISTDLLGASDSANSTHVRGFEVLE